MAEALPSFEDTEVAIALLGLWDNQPNSGP
jgi:hypothetical protein